MTFRSSRLFAAAIIFGISSCAQPAREASANAPAETKETPPAPKKPVRMNGRGKVSSISISDLFTLQQSDKVLIFDARPHFFYSLGHIPGAIGMPKANCDVEIEKRDDEIEAALAAGKTIVVYCTNFLCPDARTVATHLASYGYSSSTLSGGWDSWKESGLPTE